MATYTGSTGIKNLRDKINRDSKRLVGNVIEGVTKLMVDESPVGEAFYPSKDGGVFNDEGDYKNSWAVGLGHVNPEVRAADTTGSAAIAEGIIAASRYDLEDKVYITNSRDHAENVEYGWGANPEKGWKPKEGYKVVTNNIGAAKTIVEITASSLANK